jgi:UDP-3-O-[3-hydroxymyristoyl] N-acetylglucosamine deacetylase
LLHNHTQGKRMNFQKTLRGSVTLKGIGLHSGKNARVTIRPGRPNKGIIFVRTDLRTPVGIPAHYKNIVNTQLATTLGRGNVLVSTVEHVLAALHGLGIDNALVEVDGPEIPILDGSAEPFLKAISQAGLEGHACARTILAIRRKIEFKAAEKWAVIEPSSRLEVHGSIDWDHPAIGYQEFHYIEGKTSFSELACARTFGFMRDVEALKKNGLIRGGSLENAVVLDEARVVNPSGLRFADEFVRHKILDALGDFKLSGMSIMGCFRLHRAGHDLHAQVLAEIFKNPNNYEIISSVAPEQFRPVRVVPTLSPGYAATGY